MAQYLNKFILIGILIFLVIPVSAEIYAKDKNVGIKQPCYNDGAYCSSTAECNITVYYPDNSVLIDNKAMTNQISFHNYTLNASDINISGDYSYCITCIDSGLNASECFEFTINPPGIEPTESRTNALSRGIWFFMIISILLFGVGFMFTKSMPVRLTFFVFAGVFALITINLMFVTLQDEVVNPKVEGFFDIFVASSYYLYWGAAGLLIVMWIFTFFYNYFYSKNKKKMESFEV